MNIEQYSVLALRTINDMGSMKLNRTHMAMGIAGEAGEILEACKKHFAYDKPLDEKAMAEEIGDCLFYINGLITLMDTTWSEVLEANIRKLEKRYPDLRFNADHAINRDTAAEKEAISQVL